MSGNSILLQVYSDRWDYAERIIEIEDEETRETLLTHIKSIATIAPRHHTVMYVSLLPTRMIFFTRESEKNVKFLGLRLGLEQFCGLSWNQNFVNEDLRLTSRF